MIKKKIILRYGLVKLLKFKVKLSFLGKKIKNFNMYILKEYMFCDFFSKNILENEF